ncbi:MAG: hypothetical protein NTW21_21690 [Verrucomicrobia bacterium]|nr:hypothetical protein [Verrucomicrobiota bacterium]
MNLALHIILTLSCLWCFLLAHLQAEDACGSGPPAIPAALRPNSPEVQPERNGLPRFLSEFTPLSSAQSTLCRESLKVLRDNKPLAQPELLESLARAHRQAKKSLVPPLAFTGNEQPGTFSVALFRLFQGTEILARQALANGNRPAADSYLADLQQWSLMLRNAHPDLVQWAVSFSAWRTSFNCLLEDWQNHPDQDRRLAEIEALVQKHRTTTEELIEAARGDARWEIQHGGIKGILSEMQPFTRMTHFLKEPFAQLSAAEVLALPYDADAQAERLLSDTLELLRCLEKPTALTEWPVLRETPNRHKLDHYKTVPNGLGDLFSEQANKSLSMQFWASALSRNPLAEAGLAWLKHERNGTEITPELFRDFLDPVDGKPLEIDRESRIVRCRGCNLKADPPDPTSPPAPKAGYLSTGDDQLLIVPRWKPAK